MYQDSYGREFPMFALPKDLTITLVSGYDVVRRHAIVTRWLELEGKDKASPKTTSKTPAWATLGTSAAKSLIYNKQLRTMNPLLPIHALISGYLWHVKLHRHSFKPIT